MYSSKNFPTITSNNSNSNNEIIITITKNNPSLSYYYNHPHGHLVGIYTYFGPLLGVPLISPLISILTQIHSVPGDTSIIPPLDPHYIPMNKWD